MHQLDTWIKIDQLDVTCFIISLFNAQHVSNFSTSILRSLRLICWVISWVVLLWFDVCWCYGVVRLGWCGIRKQAEALVPPQIVFIFLCYWNRWRWKCDGVTLWFGWGGVVSGCRLEPEITQQISRKHLRMDVLKFETCWALNNEIIKQVTSSWSIFIQLSRWCKFQQILDTEVL